MTRNPLSFSPLALAGALALAGCASSHSSQSAAPVPAAVTETRVHHLADGLVYEDLVIGDGRMADPGLVVSVHYTGWLADGTKFDSSLDRGQPLKFQLGAGTMVRGMEEGVKGMRIGGKRKLTIPSDLAYGPDGRAPLIPPNAALVFDVQLVGIE